MDKPRRFAPINQSGPWKYLTVNPDGSVFKTATDKYGGKTEPMIDQVHGKPPPTVAELEALVWSGKWEEIPV